MPTSFADLAKKSTKAGPYICAFIGAVFLSIGIYLYQSQVRIEATSVPVRLVVLDMIEGSGDSRNSFAPKFQIFAGEHQGKTYIGNLHISPPIHQIGDEVDGWYQQESGLIRSVYMLAHIKSFGKTFGIIGLVLALAGIGWALLLRFRLSRSLKQQ